ncbi:hypothetical protein Tsubulata_032809 [Turnera subulata]|uniref:Mitochondrial import receptor subunit TOM6 homolog n=1 Tax=Turnera subulata TaxID=218843 RepID=A0A9Q0G4I0_9ROSI|nr:hypothetical protein Tsubulata_032809 [Turnera subulata]
MVGMFMRKPDKKEAYKKLKSDAITFGTWVALIRITPYILQFLSKDDAEELKLDF